MNSARIISLAMLFLLKIWCKFFVQMRADFILNLLSHSSSFLMMSAGVGLVSFFRYDLYDRFYWILPNFTFNITLSMASLLIYWMVLLLRSFVFLVTDVCELVGISIFIFWGVICIWIMLFWANRPVPLWP